MDKKEAKEFAIKAARFIDSKKAEDVKVYDLNGLSSLCDFVVIGTATSTPHLESLDQDSGTELKQYGVYKTNRDGGQTSTWRVSDYGAFMLHIMTNTAREFYALDKIFSFGKELKWQAATKKAATKKDKAVKTAKTKKETKKSADAKSKTIKKSVAKIKKTTVQKPKTVKKTSKITVKKTVKKAASKSSAVKKTAKKTSNKSTR